MSATGPPSFSMPHLVSEVALLEEMVLLKGEVEQLRGKMADQGTRLIEGAAARASGMTGLTAHARLTPYDGSADWAAFEAQLEIVAGRAGWTDAETAANLCLALQGDALRVLIELPAECRCELPALTRALRTRYSRQPSEAAAKMLVADRRRRQGETLVVLASEMALLTHQAYPAFPRAAQRRLALDHFLRALEPGELRKHVRLADPQTLESAVDVAERSELILSSHPGPWGALPDARDRQSWRRSRPGAQLECWSCGGRGHKQAQCSRRGNGTGTTHGYFLTCTLNGVTVNALVDTGSSVSLIQPELATVVAGKLVTDIHERIALSSVTGDPIGLLGLTELTIDVGKGPFRQQFWVGHINDPCILGKDLLSRVGAIIDCARGSVLVSGLPVETQSGRGVSEPLGVNVCDSVRDTVEGPLDAGLSADPIDEMLKRSCVGLSETQQLRLRDLIGRFRTSFAMSERECTRTSLASHLINTGDAQPIKLRPHRLALAKRVVAERLVREMASTGVIEPSSSPWSAPVVLAKKKDGNWRFCVDYRRLNAVTKLDSYPLPRIDDTLDQLSGSAWFSSLDLRSGYWQVPLVEGDREKTAFSLGLALWHFTVLPFGLCNSPATFERLMERVLSGVPRSCCVVYLDDVLAHGPDFDSALSHLEVVLGAIQAANLKLNPAKCNLLRQRVSFLGHVVSGASVETDPKKTEAVRDWPTPRNAKMVRSFVGLASYYRRFIRGFADVAAPLHNLTRPNVKFCWSEEAERAFEELKGRLCNAPILAFPKMSERFIVDTDASDRGLGAVLSQVQDGSEHVIAYYSRRLDKAERNYCVTRRELLAVVESLKHFRPYVYGVPFLLHTDHASLQWLMRFREPEGQLACWISRLQEFSFEVVHRPGRSHSNADALSRWPCVAADCKHCARAEEKSAEIARCAAVSADVAGTAGIAQVSVEQLRDAQRADRDLSWAVHALNESVTPSWGEEDPANGRRVFQVVIPRSLRDSVLRGVHGSPGAGHFGVTKTLKRLRQRFDWPGCRADVELFVHCCDVCAAKKGPSRAPRAPLHPYQCGGPMERVAVDVLGPFPVTDSGNRFVLVAMDYFTKWPEAYAVPDQGAVTTADVLVREFFCRFGVPEELHSDQGRNFESEVMAEVCRILGIHKTRTTPLHPQSDGLVERFNRTQAAQLAMVVGKNQHDWDRHLPVVLLAYRSAVQETTGFTPALLMFGRELRTPVTLAFGAPPDGGGNAPDTPSFVSDLRSSLDLAHGLARSNQSAAVQKQKRVHDPLAVGARVWLYNPQRKKGLCPKLQSAWVGPCSVLSRLGEVVYRIRWGRRTMIVHRDRLAPYRPRLLDTENGGAVPAGPAPELDPNSGSSEPLAGDAVPGPSRPPRARRLPARLNYFVCDTL
ncbi:hypothetical protein MHYP_G00314460 [Metynnis hypsauchen]